MTEIHALVKADFLHPPLFDWETDLLVLNNEGSFSFFPSSPFSLDYCKEI